MAANDLAAFFHIFGDDITSKWNYSGMTNNTILENSNIGSTTTYIHQNNTCFFFLFTQHRFGRCNGFEDEICDVKSCPFNAFINIFGGCSLPDDNVEICFQRNTRHSNGLTYPLFTIYNIFLRNDINNLLTRKHGQFIHVFVKQIHIVLGNFIFQSLAHQSSAMLHAFNVLSCNTHIDFADAYA